MNCSAEIEAVPGSNLERVTSWLPCEANDRERRVSVEVNTWAGSSMEHIFYLVYLARHYLVGIEAALEQIPR